MNAIFTVGLVLIIAAAMLFYAKFTRYGAVPLSTAWRSYTAWLSLVGVVLGQFIVNALEWLAGIWEPFRDQFGSIVSADSAGVALQAISAIFFLLRMKGQGFPKLELPSLPDDTDQAGA